MMLKCYNVPNRTYRRRFTERDVARIAKYAVDGGADPLKIIVTLMSALGFGWVLCTSSRALSAVAVFANAVTAIGGMIAASTFLAWLVRVLGADGLLFKIPMPVVVKLALAYLVLNGGAIIAALRTVYDEAGTITLAVSVLRKMCAMLESLVPQ